MAKHRFPAGSTWNGDGRQTDDTASLNSTGCASLKSIMSLEYLCLLVLRRYFGLMKLLPIATRTVKRSGCERRCWPTTMRSSIPLEFLANLNNQVVMVMIMTIIIIIIIIIILTRCSFRRQTSPSVPPPGELYETYALSLILTKSLHCMTMTSSTKPEGRNLLHLHFVVRGGPSHYHRLHAQKIW